MRLLRLHLTNFAGVDDREISFDPDGVTVLVGPNETGKSSLLAALDLLLRLPDSSRAGEVRDKQPVGRDVAPQVEAEFRTGPYLLAYAKRWLKEPQTTLRQTGPDGPQALTGREAHERVQAILDETLDRALFDALQVQQGQLSQVPLAESRSLREALDRAAGGNLGGQGEHSLLERAAAERAQYLTETGQPRGSYREARRQAEAARAAAAAIEKKLGEVERLLRDIPRLGDEVRHLERRRLEAAERLRELQQRHDAAQAQQAEVQRLDAEMARAERRHADALRDVADRGQLARTADAARRALADLCTKLEDLQGVAALQEQKAAAHAEWGRRREAAERAMRRRLEAQADLDHLQGRAALQTLNGRTQRAEEVLRRLGEAEARLLRGAPAPEALERLEQAQRAADKAMNQLEVAAARLEIAAVRDLELLVGGEALRVPAGESREIGVKGSVEVALPGQLALRVFAGGEAERLQRRAAQAEAELHRLLQEAGAASLAAARTALHERQAAAATAEQAREELRLLLGERSLEELQQEQGRLSARLAAYAAERSAEPPRDLPAAEALRREAEESEQTAVAALAQAQRREARAIEASQAAELLLAGHRRETELATQALAEAEGRLQAARAAVPDAQLAEDAGRAQAELQRVREAHAAAKAAWERMDPAQAELLLINQIGVVESLARRQREAQSDLDQAQGALQALESDGLQELGDAALRAVDAAEAELAREQRLAAAADLLHRTLSAHRERMLRDYQAPYRQAIEEMGRIVFGPSFRVELDEDLGVARRSLDGETLDFRLLSTGAKEQLAVLARLAGAMLAAGEGVPVVLDDAFGYSDPDRLALLGAVLHAVGDRCQVIVLTCFPERYQSVGRARFVRVEDLGAAAPAQGEVAAAGPAAAERILLCLADAEGPVTRRELLQRAQLAEEEWAEAIGGLIGAGRVERARPGRGTAYRLAGN